MLLRGPGANEFIRIQDRGLRVAIIKFQRIARVLSGAMHVVLRIPLQCGHGPVWHMYRRGFVTCMLGLLNAMPSFGDEMALASTTRKEAAVPIKNNAELP